MPGRDDRADWAVVGKADRRYLGEAVNNLDVDSACMTFQIVLLGDRALGKCLEIQATRLVLAYGFDMVGLYPIQLGVYDLNERPGERTRRSAFEREAMRRDAQSREGEWPDRLRMNCMIMHEPAYCDHV